MIDKIKRDTEINWEKAVNFIPKKGEIIIYDCTDQVKFKIGDGQTKINDLGFVSEELVSFSEAAEVQDETIFVR